MFRRRNTEDQATMPVDQSSTDNTLPAGKKDRPTPKRRDAEQARRERVRPALTKREQVRRDRQQMKERRSRTRQAMAKGDERHFLKRDQGEVRRFIRNYVDSRRTVAEFFLPIIVFVLLTSFIAIEVVAIFSTLMMLATMFMVIFDLVFLNVRVKREIRTRFPDDDQRGHGMYAIARATQIRKLRLPKPNVRPGDTV